MNSNILPKQILEMNDEQLSNLAKNNQLLMMVDQQMLNKKLIDIEDYIESINDIINNSTGRLEHYKKKGKDEKITKHESIIEQAEKKLELLKKQKNKLTQIEDAIDENGFTEATDMGGGKIKTKRRRKKRRKKRRKTKRHRKPRRKTKRRRKSKKSKRRRR